MKPLKKKITELEKIAGIKSGYVCFLDRQYFGVSEYNLEKIDGKVNYYHWDKLLTDKEVQHLKKNKEHFITFFADEAD